MTTRSPGVPSPARTRGARIPGAQVRSAVGLGGQGAWTCQWSKAASGFSSALPSPDGGSPHRAGSRPSLTRTPRCMPRPGWWQHPRGMCATSSWNLEGREVSPGQSCSPSPPEAGCPGVWPLHRRPLSRPSPRGVGKNVLCRPVPGAGGSGTGFFPTGGRPGRPDPRSGTRIKDRLWPRAGSGSKAQGLRRRLLSFGGRAGGLRRLLRRWVDYNGSLLCLGHFKEKFSSMNTQPASLAHG